MEQSHTHSVEQLNTCELHDEIKYYSGWGVMANFCLFLTDDSCIQSLMEILLDKYGLV